MQTQRIVYLIESAAMLAVWLGVVVTYHVMSGGRWRGTPEGRHVMVFGALFVWSGALTMVSILFGQYPGSFLVGVISYAAFVLIGVQRLALIVRAQRFARRRQTARADRAAARTSSEPPR